MILCRAPVRISFVGGGSDLPSFYKQRTGRVLSATINKDVSILVNSTPFIDKISMRYSISETVDHPSELKHTRVRAALLDLGITKGIEIGSYADLPARTGLGSSSSFSVCLLKALYLLRGKRLGPSEIAEAAFRLETELIGEPVGKQDQYAAAFGGFNIFEFHSDGSVTHESLYLDYKIKLLFADHLLLFFTGFTRDAALVLNEQNANADQNLQVLGEMADSVFEFKDNLLAKNIRRLGEILNEGWRKKKTLALGISNLWIDELYEKGMEFGAWGGKILGAGGGGCMLFVVPEKRTVREKILEVAQEMGLKDFREIPFVFSQDGVDVAFSDEDEIR